MGLARRDGFDPLIALLALSRSVQIQQSDELSGLSVEVFVAIKCTLCSVIFYNAHCTQK